MKDSGKIIIEHVKDLRAKRKDPRNSRKRAGQRKDVVMNFELCTTLCTLKFSVGEGTIHRTLYDIIIYMSQVYHAQVKFPAISIIIFFSLS